MNASDFWDDQESAGKTLKEAKAIRALVNPFEETHRTVSDTLEMLSMVEDEGDSGLYEDIRSSTEKLVKQVENLEIQGLLSGEYDTVPVYFSIHAGAGGTESCDWAQMLLRMYERFFEQNGYSFSVLSVLPGEEAGIRNIECLVDGNFPYGYLKAEIGVHRLVRISPFDSSKRRHTSFVSVDVVPAVDDVEIEINPKDLRIDTYRASGAGGQHVNKTDSAVRITHEPTNIVVQCQTERSQISNRATAMKMLQSRLWQHEQRKREEEIAKLQGTKTAIAWGSQIRSYVLQPYQMIKDHRTDHEVGNVTSVLDGDIFPFIKSFLQWQAKLKSKPEES